jgi:DNA-binding NtrC family response regulator
MSPDSQRQRILIVGEEPSVRDATRILLGSGGCECTVASSFAQALTAIEQRDFDAVVLAPQSARSQAAEVISRIDESHPHLLKRVVLISEEGYDPLTRDLAERYSLPFVQRKFLLRQLWDILESLFRPRAVFQDGPRLISDSFRDRLPVGVRTLHDGSRRLLYASGSLRVDLSVTTEEGSNRIALAGQILDSANPDRRFHGVPVMLWGWMGRTVAHATAGEFGEFHLDFNLESNISLEIKIAETQEITIPLPPLGRVRRSTAGYA